MDDITGRPMRQQPRPTLRETLDKLSRAQDAIHMELFANILNAYTVARDRMTTTRQFDYKSVWHIMTTYRSMLEHFESHSDFIKPEEEQEPIVN